MIQKLYTRCLAAPAAAFKASQRVCSVKCKWTECVMKNALRTSTKKDWSELMSDRILASYELS